VNPGVPEINVHQICLPALKQLSKDTVFTTIDNRRLILYILEPNATDEIFLGSRCDFNVGKGESFLAFALFADSECLKRRQSRHLPVDMQHLRLQKG
jgi:hypothetical protein